LVVTSFQIKPTLSIVEATVVVGRAIVEAANFDPQVRAAGVPLSVNRTSSVSPATGVPVRFVVMLVIAVAKPVKFATS
jgi:hypothetical protein